MDRVEDTEMNRSVLIVDDDDRIHASIRKILDDSTDDERLSEVESVLFASESTTGSSVSFDIDSAHQGQDAARMVTQRIEEGRPYAMAFMDMRMPPGWDGIETIEQLWQIDERLEIVICSAYSDYTWEEISDRLEHKNQLLVLKKPFENVEIIQLATALTEKWNLARQAQKTVEDLRRIVTDQTADLRRTNDDLREANSRLKYEVNERQKAEKRLWHSAFHDALTGLPNRSLLEERLSRCIARKKRMPDDAHYAVVFLDVDNFKTINDTLGHKAGDTILSETATRLQATIRELDTTARPADLTASRLGGDEFVILLDGLSDPEDGERVAQRLQNVIAEPYRVDEHTIHVTVSQGVAPGLVTYDTPEEILRDADIALYDAKAQDGKGVYRVFKDAMRFKAVSRVETEQQLREAIERHQFQLHYQPLVSLSSGTIVSVEALLRWNHPERGILMPAEVLEVAEKTALIRSMGTWVLEAACSQLHAWHELRGDDRDLTVSVNLSPRQLRDENLTECFSRIVSDTGLTPEHVILEITESTLVERQHGALRALMELKEIGFAIHLDDFGTGYSSMSYLHELPIDGIKIDRSFTARITNSPRGAANIQAIQVLARNLDMRVIVEGIETFEQLVQVQTLDCDLGQGYFFSPPLDDSDTEKLIVEPPQWMARLLESHMPTRRASA